MLNYGVLAKLGFLRVKERDYYKEIDGMWLSLEGGASDFKMTAYCAPPYLGGEGEIKSFLKKQKYIKGYHFIEVSYQESRLEMKYYVDSNENTGPYVKEAINIILSATAQFDLLPACMNCGKTGHTAMYSIKEKTGPVCDLCRSEEELRLKHERITAAHLQKDTIARKMPILDKGPLVAAVKAGVRGGLIGGLVGFIITVLGHVFYFVPVVGAFAYVAGPVAGFITMHKMRKLDYFDNGLRTLIACLISIMTLLFCAYFGFAILVSLSQGSILTLFTAFLYLSFFAMPIFLQGIVGIVLFFLIAAFVYFVDIDI